MKEEIKALINEGARKLNKKKKTYILECADSLGVKHERNLKCNDCYIDLCFYILNKLKEQDTTKEKNFKIKLKNGVRVLLNGTPINEVTCDTEEKCRYYLSHGLPKRYFDINED